MNKYKYLKSKPRTGGRLLGSLRALGAISRNARNKQLFATEAIAGTGSDSFTEVVKKGQPIKLDLSIIPSDHHIDTGKRIMRDKIDTAPIILRTSNGIKVVIGTLIAAFLSVLFAPKEITQTSKDLVKRTTDAIYNYMVKNASQKLQKGDTTIISSIYTTWRRLSSETRKKTLEKLVIDGVSYGWLAEYDSIIEIWLNKIIEIKGSLPSDKYIIDIVNIVRNKVLPVTNGIWYFKRAIKRGTGLGLSAADTAQDSYWSTYDGKLETAVGARQTLADDTMLAKIIIGLLSACEVVSNTFDLSFDIRMMLRTIVTKFKSDLQKIRTRSAMHSFKSTGDVLANDIKPHVRELQKLEEYFDKKNKKINQPYHFPQFKYPIQRMTLPTNPTTTDAYDTLQKIGAFDPFRGGVRRDYTRKTRRRSFCKTAKLKNTGNPF